MASRKRFLTRPSYVFLGGEQSGKDQETDGEVDGAAGFEFDESEVWSSEGQAPPSPDHFRKPIPSSRGSRKPAPSKKAEAATSLPVNIPDWSKILRDDHRMGRRKESDEDAEDDDDDDDDHDHDGRIPPHEYLARTRVASFSVHEGIGRTLKGRDLSRVRNAIWKTVGFED